MRFSFLTLVICSLICIEAVAQTQELPNFYSQLGQDSVVLYFANGDLVKQECATTYRYTKLTKTGDFTGPLRDYTQDSVLLLTGTYLNGQKQGLFEGYYYTGQPEYAGKYEQNKRVGFWRYWYMNGQPQLTLDISQDSVYVLEAWTQDGKPTVINGTGTVKLDWIDILEGKVKNGLLEGTWSNRQPNGYVYFTEKFSGGKFTKGNRPNEPYSDKSKIKFLNDHNELVSLERMHYSPVCYVLPPAQKKVVLVEPQYYKGNEKLNAEFVYMIRNSDFFKTPQKFEGSANVNFTVDKTGKLKDIKGGSYFDRPSKELLVALEKMVASTGTWKPGTADSQVVDFTMQLHVEFKAGNKFYVETRFFGPLDETKQ